MSIWARLSGALIAYNSSNATIQHYHLHHVSSKHKVTSIAFKFLKCFFIPSKHSITVSDIPSKSLTP